MTSANRDIYWGRCTLKSTKLDFFFFWRKQRVTSLILKFHDKWSEQITAVFASRDKLFAFTLRCYELRPISVREAEAEIFMRAVYPAHGPRPSNTRHCQRRVSRKTLRLTGRRQLAWPAALKK